MSRDFKKLHIWNQAYELTLEVYSVLNLLPEHESNNLTDQLRRAVTSIPLNIAEGAGAASNRVFFNHLNYAYGSAKELEVLLMLCRDLNYIDKVTYKKLFSSLDKLRANLFSFMASVEKEIKIGKPNYSCWKLHK